MQVLGELAGKKQPSLGDPAFWMALNPLNPLTKALDGFFQLQ
jgi:hypothetical protein